MVAEEDDIYWTKDDVNNIDKPWASYSDYLKVHYKLLRKDALRPLRKALNHSLGNIPTIKESPDFASLGIYEGVFVDGIIFSNRGVGVKIIFSLNRVGKNIVWRQSKRLITGSLVVLVPMDNAKDIKVATVAARSIEGLERNPPELYLYFAKAKDIEIDSKREFIMLEERTGYFEAERHTLLALQKMAREKYETTSCYSEITGDQNQVIIRSPRRRLAHKGGLTSLSESRFHQRHCAGFSDIRTD